MRKILEELGSRDTIAIGGHVRPDGDCVGSCMGMYLYLKKALPDAQIDVYSSLPRTLIYARQVFKSGATSTEVTEVIG